ncbi:HEAT repeat domain-containing protein [Dactylosporangium sp. NPDC000521]|uniref:HEAT repeat domain-containing protein n=1 Tax=Dactylosporangium sp. NPDC000521 TaxID=3363975 RepID=UPI0036BB53B1
MTLADVFRHVETLHGDPWPTIETLATSGDRSLIPPVQAALECYLDEHQWYGRDLMAYILAGIRGTGAFPLLLRAFARPLRHDDRDSLCALLGDVLQADPVGCRPTILSFIAEEHADLYKAGLWALGYVVQPSDLELLRRAMADPSPEIRRVALGSLSSLKRNQSAFELVASALHDQDDSVRTSAVLHLRWFDTPTAVERLIPLAHDPAAHIRSALGETIGNLPIESERLPAAVAALVSLLADPEPRVRAGAARGLGALGRPLEALQAAASDPAPQVRAAVAMALARNAGPRLNGLLQDLARDEVAAVRRDLVTGLGVCGWPDARPLIVTLTQDSDPAVRARADVALTRLQQKHTAT